ncbi:MAG: class I tRNA ligase family protein, partial [Cyclobacteriaceae bacterium]
WFIKMKDISKEAHRAVMDDEVKLHPAKFKNTYNHWMENVRDWCISRQLWWGQRIPAWYAPEELTGSFDIKDLKFHYEVAETEEEALNQFETYYQNKGYSKSQIENALTNFVHQDRDVLDTWASSWLWPISSFGGFEDAYFDKETGKINKAANEELSFFYPTATLVTAPEILFFWVARMIIAGYEYLGEKPFEDVYLTGIVRDKQRRKMSKSLGNSPDPLDLIKQYGADGIRTGMLFSSPAGNDLLFDEKLCEQGRNFSNKIWNAFRLVDSWETTDETNETDAMAISWFESRLNQALTELEDHFSKFRMSDALMVVYKLVWNDFCSAYLEWVKPDYQKPINAETKAKTVELFEELLKVLHPFMPFITEELWHAFAERSEEEALIVTKWPKAGKWDEKILKNTDVLFEISTNIRNIRNSKQIAQKEALELVVISQDAATIKALIPSLKKMANLSDVSVGTEKPANAASFVLANHEFFIPLGDNVDAEAEKARIEEELKYNKGFLLSVDKKLSNERFVAGAPAQVVEMEKKKKADAEAKIKALEEQLASL